MGANSIDANYEEKIAQLQRTIDRRDEEIKIFREALDKKNQLIKELEADLRYMTLGIRAIRAILED
jgi:predicted RNase H-like nuclease (RuvC/YqgF family)